MLTGINYVNETLSACPTSNSFILLPASDISLKLMYQKRGSSLCASCLQTFHNWKIFAHSLQKKKKKEKKKTKPNQNKHSCAKRSFLLQVSTNQLQWSGEEGGSASPCQSPEAAWPPVACVSWGLQQGLPGRCVCSRKDGTRRWISAGCVLSQKATSACVFATWQEVLNLTLSVLPYWKLTGQTGFRQLCSVRWVASALFCFAASCNCNLLSSSSVGEKNIEMQFIPGAYWTSLDVLWDI